MKDTYAVQHSNGETEKEFGISDTHMQDVVPVREKRMKREKANMPTRGKLTLLVIAIQAALIILFAIFVRYEETDKDEHSTPMDGVKSYYPSKLFRFCLSSFRRISVKNAGLFNITHHARGSLAIPLHTRRTIEFFLNLIVPY